MKTSIKPLFLLLALTAAFGLMPVERITAQIFLPLHGFDPNTDGYFVQSPLTLSSNTLYGTISSGGIPGYGEIFKVNTDGSGFVNIYNFTSTSATNNGGALPNAGMVISSNALYGTAQQGGSYGVGLVFKVNTDGTGFTNVFNFSFNVAYPDDGGTPNCGLVLSGNTLYGTAAQGGSNSYGSVFKVNTDGTGFKTLHSFARIPNHAYTNSDGVFPFGELVLSGDTLYGVCNAGGAYGSGTVFRVNTNGTGFTNLYNYTGINGVGGVAPGLTLSNNILYGTQTGGGTWTNGMIFAVNTDGTGFRVLYNFGPASSDPSSGNHYTNSDGIGPNGGLVLVGGMLYGMAYGGGLAGAGTLFAVNTNGTGFTNLYNFTGDNGANPVGGMILSGNILYGTTWVGSGNGVYGLSFAPPLAINLSGTNVVLTWPTNVISFSASGLGLQTATDLSSGTWNNISPVLSVVNGLNTATNPVAGTQMFYRLSQ